ncbi:MAG TPA: hypothetical protein P5114_05110 [Hyphomicrobiaceae bacterium]|nr:hypothetical protein [Hyphomicrobiaceae bacterium]
MRWRACRLMPLIAIAALALGACAPSSSNVEAGAATDSSPATVSNAAVTNATVANTTAINDAVARAGVPAPSVRTSAIVPGRAARVFIFAGVDQNCASLPEPELTVTKPPAKGDILFRPGQTTKLAATASGTCIGTKAVGTGVYYTARAGTSGADTFTVTARLASGETMSRDFPVQIAE